MKNISLLFKRLLIVIIIYFITRCLFIWSNNKYLHIDTFISLLKIFWGGIRFDISAIIYVNLIFIFLHITYYKKLVSGKISRVIKWLYLITNGCFIAINIIDVAYYSYTFKRMQQEVFSIIGDVKRLTIPYLSGYWYLLLLFILLMILINWLYNKTCSKIYAGKISIIARIVSFVLIIGLTVLGARGGFQMKPIDSTMAIQYALAGQTNAVVNTPFTFLHSLFKRKLSDKKYFLDAEVNKIFPVVHAAIPETGRKPNIIIIVLESFAKRFIGGLSGNSISYTPFLDSLINYSTVFTNSFANSHVSIDGNFSTFFGLLPLTGEPILYSIYKGNRFNGIASLLLPLGYKSAFFHGASNGSFKLDNMSLLAGFEKYYGRTEYDNDADYDGAWGIWDEPFLQFAVKKMNEIPQPFVSGIFTVTSHHPFKVPDQYKNIFKEGSESYHKVIQYTDYALSKFFAAASKQPWFANTLFFICADHSVISSNSTEGNEVNQFRIPILIFDPAHAKKKIYNYTVQQCDILPTILNITGTTSPFVSFGNNMLDSSAFHFTINRDGNTYRFFTNEYALIVLNEKPVKLYEFKKDPELNNNIVNKDIRLTDSLLTILKAALQQYNNRMNENRMIPDEK